MKVKTKVTVEMAPVRQVVSRLGVAQDGDVQMFITEMVSHRITRYMPYSSGVLATKTKFLGGIPNHPKKNEHMADKKVRITKPTEITVLGPYAHYQYMGKVWEDPKLHEAGFLTENGWRSRKYVPKVETGRKLTYDTSKNERAGPFWDRELIAAEGAAMAADVQEYVDRKAGKK